MIDSFISGILTLIVLFGIFAMVTLVIEAVPFIGYVLLLMFFVLFGTTLMTFFDKRR